MMQWSYMATMLKPEITDSQGSPAETGDEIDLARAVARTPRNHYYLLTLVLPGGCSSGEMHLFGGKSRDAAVAAVVLRAVTQPRRARLCHCCPFGQPVAVANCANQQETCISRKRRRRNDRDGSPVDDAGCAIDRRGGVSR
jgi:hypothetical protein